MGPIAESMHVHYFHQVHMHLCRKDRMQRARLNSQARGIGALGGVI
jgi:hypothetical protein